MVTDKVSSNKSTSPVRSSSRIRAARFQPTARETSIVNEDGVLHRNLNQSSSTIYKLHIPRLTQDQSTVGRSHSYPCPSHLLQRLKNVSNESEPRHHMTSLMRHNTTSLRNVKRVLDKVEDMDVDHQSDHEGASLAAEDNNVGPSSSTSSNSSAANTSGLKTEKSVTNKKGNKNCLVAEIKKTNTNESPSQAENRVKKANETSIKKKPVYIILHSSLLRVGHLEGRALKPVRIQAGRILIEMEFIQSHDKKVKTPSETLQLRIPSKELLAIKVNLSQPPFLFVAVINKTYSKSLIESSKNGILYRLKAFIENLQVIVRLMYDVIPDEIRTGFSNFRGELATNVTWEDVSSITAERILNGEDCTILENDKEYKEDKGNRKRQINCKVEMKKKETSSQSAVEKEGSSSSSKHNNIPVEKQESQRPSSPVVKRRRMEETNSKIKSPEGETEERTSALEEKSATEDKVASLKTSQTEVVSTDGANNSLLNEGSFEENRVDAMKISELQSNIVEKGRVLTQQRRMVELRDLQLQQERDLVRELRSSLREEQRTKRDLEARFEAISNELLTRNTHTDSRMNELERELSELNLSLSNSRSENERLAQEIHQVRDRLTEKEELLRTEEERKNTLEREIEMNQTNLETLGENIRQKDSLLSQEREMRIAANERNTELEQQLLTTRTEYEERIARDHAEHERTRQENEECNRLLFSTREQLEDANRALHRAQETVEEYSRMQPRDWTISRDEVEITDKVLGQGAWGWVKEGRFRGTPVAVKQMHELIVSPHNRRLFEREMQIGARCRHPNLLQFIGATNDNGIALLVTELLDTDLRTVLGRRSLCHEEVVTIAFDVSRALNYLHLNKPYPIIHRDISSTNVLLWKRDNVYRAKLSDYGAANFMRQCMTVSPGACIYAAPEAMTSRQSTKVDVYSFGLLLCEMCIRELPVPGDTNEQIRAITNAHLRDLVQRSTNETPEDRPTMSEILTALLSLRPNSTLGMFSIRS